MKHIPVFSPIDGRHLGDFAPTEPTTLAEQFATARQAGQQWAKVPVKTRARILDQLVTQILANLDELCDCLVQTTGKVPTEALLGEIYPLLDLIRYYAKQANRILADQSLPTSPFAYPGATVQIQRQPYGVVAVISPWSYPFQLTMAPVITALLAGNAVIFKTSELSLPIGDWILRLCQAIDLPAGLVQTVIGASEVGERLIDAAPDLIFFTGGLQTGRAVMQRAAQHPVPVILELGGKDPMLVFADADLQRAEQAALYGAFCHSGQVCVSIERLFVEHRIFAAFLQQLLSGLAQLLIGHGEQADLGAMTCDRQFAIIQAQYDDAIAKGAKASGPLERTGNYLKPVILWQVSPDMKIMREETFGPLLPVMAFASESEAIALANDCELGLNASIWSQDIAKAERVAKQLQVGNWVVNDVLKNIGHPGLPFGGVKKSGFGRYHGAEGLLNFTYPVSGMTNRSHLAKEPNWFPYSKQSYQAFKAYLDFVYGSGWWWQRGRRNWQALQAFKEYSAFDIKQRWQNLKLLLSCKRSY